MFSKGFKTVLVCVFMVFALVAFAGCGGSGDDTASDTLIMAYPSDTGNLNAHTYDSQMWVQSAVYEGLTRYVDGKVVGGIAENWDISDDGREYTFHLRKGNVFSDGTPVNAEIVKKNLDAVLVYRDVHEWMETINQIKEVIAVDENTVKVILNEPFSAALQEFAFARPLRIGAEAMFPEGEDTSKGIAEPIGSGRWIQIEHVEGQYTIFERNEKYWGEKPSYKYLRVNVVPDINTAVSSLQAGEIDLIYDLEAQMTGDTYNLLKNSGFNLVSSDPDTTSSILLNTNRGATKDINVRLALEYATDKQSISDNVYYGLQVVANTLIPTSTPYCDVGVKGYNYDVAKAKSLLDEAGWKLADGATYRTKDGKELVLSFIYIGDNESAKTLGQVLQNQYQQIGVKVNLEAQDESTYYDLQKTGGFDMLLAESWGAPFDPHSYLSSFRNPSHGDYAAQVGLPMKKQIDDAISKALNSTDESEVQASYKYVLTTLNDQAVYVPIVSTTKQAAFGDNVSGVRFNTSGDIPFEDFTINK